MSNNEIERVVPMGPFTARLQVPGDKSMSHRALIFSAMADGVSEIRGLLEAADVASTRACLEAMGVLIENHVGAVRVTGVGLHGLQAPEADLDCGNSGTTMRLLMGLLAGQPFTSRLVGDASLSKRPMARSAEPLRTMGAQIALHEQRFAPVEIAGARLRGIDYILPVASAQLKSALLLAGLYADGPITLHGEIASRDHTERMLPHYGVRLEISGDSIRIQPGQILSAARFDVPGDPSTAAFWLAAAALLPGSQIELPNVSLNPTRLGFVRVLARMGAKLVMSETLRGPEPQGTIRINSGGTLKGTTVAPDEIPEMIDEVPLIAVLGAFAEGRTEVRGAGELRIKESDRLEAIAVNLRNMGGTIELFEDGFALEGPQQLKGADIDPMQDHRIAMAFAVAGLAARGETRIYDPECVAISYPGFFTTLNGLKGKS